MASPAACDCGRAWRGDRTRAAGPLPGALEALLGALMIAYAAAVERFGEPACDGLWGFCSRVTAGRLIAPEQPT